MPVPTYKFSDFELDLERYEVRKDGSPVKLEKIPMELLIYMVENSGRLITREQIVNKLWGKDIFVDTEQGINTAVRKIRLALADSPEQPRFLETVVGKGYRFVAAVHTNGMAEEQAQDEGNLRDTARTAPKLPPRKAWIAGAAAVVLLGASIGLWRTTRAGKTSAQKIRSVAVLPLENMSGEPQQEIFADGMTDELTTMLARIKGLRVISRTSVVGYKGTRKHLPQIAKELNVDAIVEGSVLRSGNKVRITAQLINAATDEHLWADTYERELSDVMAVQSEVAEAIARHVFVELTAEERQHIRVERRVNPAAHDLVLRGRSLWNKRDEASLQQAIECFQQALALDPNYAMAYVGLADSYNALGYSNYVSPADSFVRAKAAASKAIELDPDLAEAHASYGYATMYYDWDFGRAEREFQAALGLNPNSPQAHQWYAYLLTAMERPSEAHRHIDIAQQLDPASVPINTDRAFTYYYSGETEEAVKSVNTALQINPDFPLAHFWLGRIYTSQGRYDEALSEFTKTGALRSWQPTLSGLGFLYGIWGKKKEAQGVLDELAALPRQNRYRTSYAVALIYCGMGDKEATFHWLDEAYKERTHWLVWLKTDPRWNSVRSDPRFRDLVRRVGLPI